jgi:glycosyltransferase involved in cell wall biosynthesis
MKIHVWVPDFTGATGGIQTFSRFLVRGLRDCFPGAELRVLAKNDTSVPDVEERSLARFDSVGTWPEWQRTGAFTSKLLWSGYRDRPDLIIVAHVNFAPVAHWLRKLFGIPFIVIGHGVEIWSDPGRHISTALRHATQLLAVSNFTRERMAGVLGISRERIGLLPNTFDPDEFTVEPKPRFLLKRYKLRADQPVILTIARLASAERYKGYDQMLRAIARVREKFPDVCYLLGGRGPDRPRVTNLVAQLGLTQNVILAGFIPVHELCAHYTLCDVFAMPSKGEGFGIVFLEAVGCGKPVIAGNKDGSVDAVLNGRLGVLVDPDDPKQIGDAIMGVLERSPKQGARSKEQRVGSGEQGGGSQHQRARSGFAAEAAVSIPEIVFEPESLRREVINVYGYGKFVERLGELLGKVDFGK